VDIYVNNQLGASTTMHWHGVHVSAENDRGPHTVIESNDIWNPHFTVMDNAGTYWYHPHLHQNTNLHVSKGIAGFIIVRDNEEAALNIPSNSDSAVMVNATVNAQTRVVTIKKKG